MNHETNATGFTLIEISIVLVIIGLIVGGVLVGRDLITAASVRAQISQIEKYQLATKTFRIKYDALPGDMPAATATAYGFAPRGTGAGRGDNNGILEGINFFGSSFALDQGGGENPLFWRDLSFANLVDGQFNTASATVINATTLTGSTISTWYPPAKLEANYVYVYSGIYYTGSVWLSNGTNYFGLSGVNQIRSGFINGGLLDSKVALSASQAYSIDNKVDDGFPQSGSVQAKYVCLSNLCWAAGGGAQGASSATYDATNNATPASEQTCYDNNNISGPQKYTLSQGGNDLNCALSFKFQ